LFPTDFSNNADRAFEFVKELATSGAKKVTITHVEEVGKIFADSEHRLNEFNIVDTKQEIYESNIIAENRMKKLSGIDTSKLKILKSSYLMRDARK